MLDRDAELRVTRAKMAYVREEQDMLTELDPLFAKSAGVSRWGRIGGGGGFISDPTQTEAIRRASLTEEQREHIAWMETVYAAYFDLLQRPGRTANKALHDRIVAKVLKEHVFDRLSFDQISVGLGKTGKQHAHDLYAEAVEAVREKAKAARLFKA